MTIRTSFEERFGADAAAALVRAAAEHQNGVHDERGSDPFKWAVAIVLGFQCVEKYSEHHDIDIPWEDFRDWVKAEADLGTHDGDVDYLALMAGVYEEYVEAPV